MPRPESQRSPRDPMRRARERRHIELARELAIDQVLRAQQLDIDGDCVAHSAAHSTCPGGGGGMVDSGPAARSIERQRKITPDTAASERAVPASTEQPQYLVRSDKGGGEAVHRPSALWR